MLHASSSSSSSYSLYTWCDSEKCQVTLSYRAPCAWQTQFNPQFCKVAATKMHRINRYNQYSARALMCVCMNMTSSVQRQTLTSTGCSRVFRLSSLWRCWCGDARWRPLLKSRRPQRETSPHRAQDALLSAHALRGSARRPIRALSASRSMNINEFTLETWLNIHETSSD